MPAAAVRRRAVDDAFDPRYGARTVKRWLEDKIGGALTDLLATASPARLRIVRLAEDRGEIQATLEPMLERPALPGPFLLEGALDLATAALEPAIVIAAAALARVRDSQELARARREASGELRYYVDELEPAPRRARPAVRRGARARLRDAEPTDEDDDEDLAPRPAARAARPIAAHAREPGRADRRHRRGAADRACAAPAARSRCPRR